MIALDARVSDLRADYRLVLNKREVTEFALSSLTLEDADNRMYSKLNVGFTRSTTQDIKVDAGMSLRLYYKDETIFDGIVFIVGYSDDYSISVTAYDHGIYYAKNYVTKTFKNTTAGAIIKAVANDVGLPVDSVEDTRYVIPEYVMDDKSIQSVIYDTLEITEAQLGVKYRPTLRKNKLVIAKSIKPDKAIVIETGVNVIAITREISIEDLANYVIVRGGDKDNPTTAVAQDAESIKRYGRMMFVESVDEKAKPSHAKDRANSLLRENKAPSSEVSLTALGDFNVRVGTHIYVKDSEYTHTAGEYVVSAVTHSVEMTGHTMALTLEAV